MRNDEGAVSRKARATPPLTHAPPSPHQHSLAPEAAEQGMETPHKYLQPAYVNPEKIIHYARPHAEYRNH